MENALAYIGISIPTLGEGFAGGASGLFLILSLLKSRDIHHQAIKRREKII
jgi:hypothetical protein